MSLLVAPPLRSQLSSPQPVPYAPVPARDRLVVLAQAMVVLLLELVQPQLLLQVEVPVVDQVADPDREADLVVVGQEVEVDPETADREVAADQVDRAVDPVAVGLGVALAVDREAVLEERELEDHHQLPSSPRLRLRPQVRRSSQALQVVPVPLGS